MEATTRPRATLERLRATLDRARAAIGAAVRHGRARRVTGARTGAAGGELAGGTLEPVARPAAAGAVRPSRAVRVDVVSRGAAARPAPAAAARGVMPAPGRGSRRPARVPAWQAPLWADDSDRDQLALLPDPRDVATLVGTAWDPRPRLQLVRAAGAELGGTRTGGTTRPTTGVAPRARACRAATRPTAGGADRGSPRHSDRGK